jgi:hypothetical protein
MYRSVVAGSLAGVGLMWVGVRRGTAQSTETPTPATDGTDSGTSSQAEAGGAGDFTSETISNALVDALRGLLETLFTPIRSLIESQANNLLGLLVGTPHPTVVFAEPKTAPWIALYQYYWETMIPLTLLLFGLSVGMVILLESTSHLFSSYHRVHLKRRAFVGLVGVLSWWWIAAFSLQVADQLSRFLMPELDSISLFETLSFASIGLLGIVVSLSIDLVLFGLIALIYFVRQLVLYGFVLGMPLLIIAWIPGVGPFQYVARFAQRLAGFYVPFLLMAVPIALLFRLGELLGESATLSIGGVGLWLSALVIPFVAVISPFILIWQAGGIFFVADQMARHASRERVLQGTGRARQHASDTVHAGRNAMRGLRNEPAVRRDGQTLLRTTAGTATSRGHRAGAGLRSTSATLRNALRDRASHGGSDPVRDVDRYEPREYDSGVDPGATGRRSRDNHPRGRDR